MRWVYFRSPLSFSEAAPLESGFERFRWGKMGWSGLCRAPHGKKWPSCDLIGCSSGTLSPAATMETCGSGRAWTTTIRGSSRSGRRSTRWHSRSLPVDTLPAITLSNDQLAAEIYLFLSAQNKRLVTAGSRNTVQIHTFPDGEPDGILTRFTTNATHVAFNSSGTKVAAGSRYCRSLSLFVFLGIEQRRSSYWSVDFRKSQK